MKYRKLDQVLSLLHRVDERSLPDVEERDMWAFNIGHLDMIEVMADIFKHYEFSSEFLTADHIIALTGKPLLTSPRVRCKHCNRALSTRKVGVPCADCDNLEMLWNHKTFEQETSR